jgi:uncharacterized protein
MSVGLLALLDDVAAIVKMSAASLDDIVAQSAKAGSKAVGVVIDDTAVTPKYVTGLSPARELPIIYNIAKGSLKNKLLILTPGMLAIGQIAPFLISPLLIAGRNRIARRTGKNAHRRGDPHRFYSVSGNHRPFLRRD